MDRVQFYRDIVSKGVYTIFNELRTNLFSKLATDSHLPIASTKLDEVISDCGHLHESQIEFIKCRIEEGNRFRCHECAAEGLQVYYFVNVNKEKDISDEVASHLQERNNDSNAKIIATSAIILFEKHPNLQPINYPKIIKHELVHAAIEFVINDDPELTSYYFSDNPIIHTFVEFVCDVIPYLSNPSKKENGINKFLDESVSCFGYDAEEGGYAEFIKDIITAMEQVPQKEDLALSEDDQDVISE